jgi:hypothetical protein
MRFRLFHHHSRRFVWLLCSLLSILPIYVEAATREGSNAPAPPDPAVLSRILARVDSLRAASARPVVIFDIDGTLTDPAPRTRAAFQWHAEKHASDRRVLTRALRKLPVERYAYAPESTLALMGIRDTAMVRRVVATWRETFFSNRFLDRDTAIPGAPAYVDSLWKSGAIVVYFTGRDVPRMLEGTLASLRDRGFPVAQPRIEVVMKADPAMKDRDFKPSEFDELSKLGTVVAVFENEPANINAQADRFPDALATFLDTNHSPGAPPVRARVAWVKDFRLP